MIGLTNVAYGESDYDPDGGDRDPGTDAVNKYFTNATNTEKLVQAFEDTFRKGTSAR